MLIPPHFWPWCPFAPLLFALCIKPLASTICAHSDIIFWHHWSSCVKWRICLYADDILWTVTNPLISLANLHRTLEEYGALSGYKIITTKTEALPINIPVLAQFHAHFNNSWKTDLIKYLGVHITSRQSKTSHPCMEKLLNNFTYGHHNLSHY